VHGFALLVFLRSSILSLLAGVEVLVKVVVVREVFEQEQDCL
jgi:hypothetical protein